MYRTAQAAIKKARDGDGPSLMRLKHIDIVVTHAQIQESTDLMKKSKIGWRTETLLLIIEKDF